ncbi:MAG: hypothetical protein ACFCVF_04315 [Kineosporiaceae bacterium]
MAGDSRLRVIITTFRRPDGLAWLLDDLEREGTDRLDVHVYDDGSPVTDLALRRRLDRHGWTLHEADRTHGKAGFWRWWNVILDDLRADPGAEPVLALQDDVRLCESFLDRALGLWHDIDDPAKGALHLLLTTERESGRSGWAAQPPTPAGEVTRTGWVDLAAFLASRRLFDAVGWRLDPVPAGRWSRSPEASSGVGRQLSIRAGAAGAGMYQVRHSLVVHDDSPSLMNPEARRRWPMTVARFVDGDAAAAGLTATRPKVVAALASQPRRAAALAEVVRRLYPQVDRLQVYLNGYRDVPGFLERPGIEVATSTDTGDRGDAGKFWWAGTITGVQLACDDDIAYPEDYVSEILAGLARTGFAAAVGFHASLFRTPFTDWSASRRILHLAAALPADRWVHVLGTGTAAYHSSAMTVEPADFPVPNIADAWFGLLGARQGVPFLALARQRDWLRELPAARDPGSLSARARARARAWPGALDPATAVVIGAGGPWELRTQPGTHGPVTTGTDHGGSGAPDPRGRVGGAPRRGGGGAPATGAPSPARRTVRVRVLGPHHAGVLVLDAEDSCVQVLRSTGTYPDAAVLARVRALGLRGTYADLGAGCGARTVYFALECRARRVVAVEPDPAAHDRLRQTLEENGLGHATAIPGAVGDPSAPTLDAVLAPHAPVALVHAERPGIARVLSTGRTVLRRDRPVVVARPATRADEVATGSFLAGLGYRLEWEHLPPPGQAAAGVHLWCHPDTARPHTVPRR